MWSVLNLVSGFHPLGGEKSILFKLSFIATWSLLLNHRNQAIYRLTTNPCVI